MFGVTFASASFPVQFVAVSDNADRVQAITVGRAEEAPDAPVGILLVQAGAAPVDDSVAGLTLGAGERRFHGRVGRAGVQALELGQYTIDRRVRLASVTAVAVMDSDHRWSFPGQVIGHPPFAGQEPAGTLVHDPEADPIDLAPGQRPLPCPPHGRGQRLVTSFQAGAGALVTARGWMARGQAVKAAREIPAWRLVGLLGPVRAPGLVPGYQPGHQIPGIAREPATRPEAGASYRPM